MSSMLPPHRSGRRSSSASAPKRTVLGPSNNQASSTSGSPPKIPRVTRLSSRLSVAPMDHHMPDDVIDGFRAKVTVSQPAAPAAAAMPPPKATPRRSIRPPATPTPAPPPVTPTSRPRRSVAFSPAINYTECSDPPSSSSDTSPSSRRVHGGRKGGGRKAAPPVPVDLDDPDKDPDFQAPSASSSEDEEEDDSSENSTSASDDEDEDADMSELEGQVADVDPGDVTMFGPQGSPSPATPSRRRQSRRAGTPAGSPLVRDAEIRLPSCRFGGRRSTAPIDLARQRLQAREVPKMLPCRDIEVQAVFDFVESRLRQGCGGGCMYISGLPGTGKTATVMEALRSVAGLKIGDLPEYDTVLVNGMKVTEPKRIYSAIFRQLHKVRAPWQVALRRLKSEFTGGRSRPCVLLVDELDMLCTKRQDVLYNLFEWPQHPCSRLIVLAVANTMDLPERVLVHRVSSRLGLSRQVFQSYTHEQLTTIVKTRLQGTCIFDDEALEYAARKVAAVSGDCRRALDLCSRSCDLAEQEFGGALAMERFAKRVEMTHVQAAIAEMFTSPTVKAVAALSGCEQLAMRACLNERTRTGLEENPAGRVWWQMMDLARSEGHEAPAWPMACAVLGRLHACRLLLWEGGHRGQVGRVCLNCAPQDVLLGLQAKKGRVECSSSGAEAAKLLD